VTIEKKTYFFEGYTAR